MAQLREGSIIRKSTGDEIIATETQLNNHNTDVAAHNDIRQQIKAGNIIVDGIKNEDYKQAVIQELS